LDECRRGEEETRKHEGKEEMIPKIIHAAWPSKDILTSSSILAQKGVQKLIELNPDWKFELSNDEDIDNYLREKMQSYYSVVEDVSIIEKCDLWRLLKIYHEGGVYIDLDRMVNTSFNDILKDGVKCVLPTCRDSDFSHDIMISEPLNPIFEKAITLVVNRRITGNKSIYFLGPQTYMHSITECLFTKQVDSNPSLKEFTEMRNAIENVSFLDTYREDPPYKTFVFRDEDVDFDHETEKRKLYAEFNLKHWTNEW
jgi:mannosyltransferase OCH1-like enzyme